ncbi:MAG TPA: hypothetical protein VG476_07545 [Acidimicrobiales bacterium]|nr:hypothetical protein [Acidimicrobiales bacterium]
MTRSPQEEAAAMVAGVRDDPAGRLELAARFYDSRIADIRAYRRAEMAFMRWQIQRGVLASSDANRPGSPWWRAVNEGLIRDAWEAELSVDCNPEALRRPSVGRWIAFLRRPSAGGWYRAHNASIVAGYLAHRDLVELELPVERFFMDVALGRVLYADSLLSAPRLALGHLAPAARLLGDPRWRGADAFLSLDRILPDRYPLEGVSMQEILDVENYFGRLIDYGVILPRVQALYVHAASALNEPRLLEMVRDGFPVYAWPYEERHVWITTRAPWAIRVLRRVTRSTKAIAGG